MKKLLMLIMVVLVSLFSILIGSEEQNSPSNEVISYTPTTKTSCVTENNNKTCSKTFYSGVMNFYNGSTYVPITKDIINESINILNTDYSAYNDRGIYSVYYKEQSSDTSSEPIRFSVNDYTLTITPNSLKFLGQTNKHKKQSFVNISNNYGIYKGQFGDGIDLRYSYYNGMLKKELIINSLQELKDAIKDNPFFDDILQLKFTVKGYNVSNESQLNNLRIGSSRIDFSEDLSDVSTEENIEFLDSNNNTIYYFPQPYVEDNEGNRNMLNYTYDVNRFSNLVVKVEVPYFYLENAVYPIVIDPTVKIESAGQTGDFGSIYRYDPGDWDATHDATSGGSVTNSGELEIGVFTNSYMDRAFFPFNTSIIPDNISISSVEICLYVITVDDDINDAYSYMVFVGNTTQADYTSLAIADFNDCGDVDNPTEFSERIDLTTITTSSYNCFTLNGNGTNALNTSGISFFGFREGHDVEDVAPSTPDYSYIYTYGKDTQPSYLNITYTFDIPEIKLNNPINDLTVFFKDKPFNFNFTINDSTYNIAEATLWANSSGTWQQNVTNSSYMAVGDNTNTTLWGNLSRGYFIWNIYVCNVNGDCDYADNNWTLWINNSIPTVASATINNSNPADSVDIQCDNGSVTELDIEDTVTLHYDWYNSTDGSTFYSTGYDSKTLSNTNLTTNWYWKCLIYPTDSYGDSGVNVTSATIQVGSSNIAPIINTVNCTTAEAGVISNATNPTNNNSYVKVAINWSDVNGDKVMVYACTTDSATIIGCNAGTWFNTSINTSNKPFYFNISSINLTTQDNNFYVFLKDNFNSPLLSASKKGTFEVNFPPLEVNMSKAGITPTNGVSFAQTFVNFSWATAVPIDLNNDNLNYTLYADINSNPTTIICNCSSTTYDWTGLSDARYYWKIKSTDEHSYDSLANSSIRSFTISTVGPVAPSGGGAPGVKVEEKLINITIERFCGDGFCDEDLWENPWNCPKDCLGLVLKLSDIFCMPLFKCGNWEKAWFINIIILIIGSFLVYFMVLRKPGRLR